MTTDWLILVFYLSGVVSFCMTLSVLDNLGFLEAFDAVLYLVALIWPIALAMGVVFIPPVYLGKLIATLIKKFRTK